MVTVLNQKSSGTVTLKSANPFEYPLINLNYLSDKENRHLETLYQSVQIILKLLETKAFRRMNVSLAVTEIPGCKGVLVLLFQNCSFTGI